MDAMSYNRKRRTRANLLFLIAIEKIQIFQSEARFEPYRHFGVRFVLHLTMSLTLFDHIKVLSNGNII